MAYAGDNKQMDSQAIDFQHETILNSIKGTLLGPDDASLQSSRQALSWARQAMGDDFDPHRPLTAGAPIGEMLLKRSTKHFNPRFMEEWIDQFGITSIFPEAAGTRLVSHWIATIRKSLSSTYHGSAESDAPLLAWLLERAPASAVPLDPLPAIADQLEKQRTSSGLKPAFQVLLDNVLRHAASQVDSARPPLRWLPSSVLLVQPIDLSVPVVCPSGTVRTLKDLALLREAPNHSPSAYRGAPASSDDSPSTIPQLPHGRKMELARDWMLDPDITIDTARSRLWACIEEKPEAIDQLMLWMKSAPRGHPEFPARIEEILRTRDTFGRGVMAWLACSNAETSARLMQHLGDLIGETTHDVLAADGAGLVEQLLTGRRLGFASDAFHGRDVSKWGKLHLDAALIAGPFDRRDRIIADLIDVAIPFGIHQSLMDTMSHAAPDPRLEVAHAWSKLFEALRHPPIEHSGLPGSGRGGRSRGNAYASNQRDRLVASIDRVLEAMTQYPGVLAIGTVEWRQWTPMFLEKCFHYEVNSSFQGSLKEKLPDLERIMEASDLHMHVPQAQPARAGPRF